MTPDTTIKALSVKNPWASLIASGAKDVENRSWNTTYRGPLLICASKTPDKTAWDRIDGLALNVADRETVDLLTDDDLHDGMAVAIVDLVDVVDDHPSPWAFPGQKHLVLANPRRITPFPVRGQLGLYDVELPESRQR